MKLLIDGVSMTLKQACRAYDLIPDSKKMMVYAVVFNDKLKNLDYVIDEDGTLEWVYAESDIGHQIYERTLSFLFTVAVHRLYPNSHVTMEHALSNGLYCTIQDELYITPKHVSEIHDEMKRLVDCKLPIERLVMDTKQASALFDQIGKSNTALLLKNRDSAMSSVYVLDEVYDYYYGIVLPNTKYVTHFTLRYYAPGIWLSDQDVFVNQRKIFRIFREFEDWGKCIGVSEVAQLNEKILHGQLDELVLMSETMAEKKLEEITVDIVQNHPDTRFVLIAGPSSAGKTTFSKRLSIHLKIHGKEPIAISMDDFYKNRSECKKLPDGNYDFDSVDALDLNLFNETLLSLLHGVPTKMPRYNFKTGLREWKMEPLVMEEDQILIIEGIHGLNPVTSTYIPANAKYRIYINALTHLNLDDHNRVSTSDYRLLRRITRDHQFRGWSAANTIKFWKNVRDAENRYIYPFQEEADMIYNSSMVYELSVIKSIVVPLLKEVQQEDPEYLEANRLCKLMDYFVQGSTQAIPRFSILAEFIGNSIFDL